MSSELIFNYQLEKCFVRIYRRILIVVYRSELLHLIDVRLILQLAAMHTFLRLTGIDSHDSVAKQSRNTLIGFQTFPFLGYVFQFAFV